MQPFKAKAGVVWWRGGCTRKRRWRYIFDESALVYELSISSFPVVSLTSYYLICCLFEATKQR